jgi:hypothetical protein
MLGNNSEMKILQKEDYKTLITESDEIAAIIVGF